MNRRVTVTLYDGKVLEFGSFLWKWWHRLTRGGKWHWVVTGESCILHDPKPKVPK